jgi:Protein of unknown function (DUF3465)
MKKYILLAVFAVAIYGLAQQQGISVAEFSPLSQSDTTLQTAFANHQSDLQLQGQGVVKKVLPDDRKGLQHQKFILQTGPEQTVLVAHNIEVADRLPGLKKGEIVEFYGEYEWTAQGGVVHWTHHDPSGRHQNGWLKYNGRTYQ